MLWHDRQIRGFSQVAVFFVSYIESNFNQFALSWCKADTHTSSRARSRFNIREERKINLFVVCVALFTIIGCIYSLLHGRKAIPCDSVTTKITTTSAIWKKQWLYSRSIEATATTITSNANIWQQQLRISCIFRQNRHIRLYDFLVYRFPG